MSNKPPPKKGYSPKRDRKPVEAEPSAADIAAAEDAEREMYGEDYDHLRDSGWLDK